MRGGRLKRTLAYAMGTVAFLAAYYFLFMPETQVVDLELVPGKELSRDLVAPVDFEVPFSPEEQAYHESVARENVPVYLRREEGAWEEMRSRLSTMLMDAVADSQFTAGILGELGSLYEDPGVFSLSRVRERYQGDDVVLLSGGTTQDRSLVDLNELQEVGELLESSLGRWDIGAGSVEEMREVLEPNLVPDDSARQARTEAVVGSLGTTDTLITAGSVLLEAGEPATARTVELLGALRDSGGDGGDTARGIAVLLLGALLLALGIIYVRELMTETWEAVNRSLLLGSIWLIALLSTGVLWLALREAYGFPYATLVTFGAALTSIFFHRRDAFFMTVLFSLAVGLAHPHPFSVTLVTLASGTLAAMTAWDVRSRSSIPTAAALAALVGMGVFLLLEMLHSSIQTVSMPISMLELLLAPVVGVGAASAMLFPMEKLFGVYTALSIDEVNRTDHPLLKRMREVAPGSWNHSQMVSELAGQGAEAIGAWSTLASAGGYFHDLGKMKRPEYFIENQRDEPSPHEDLSPWESARIIIEHAANGVEMAEKAKLPLSVVDIVRQHHGTSLVRYFYRAALSEAADPDSVDESEFRYPGPKPTSVEAAIVMLADQVASATKNLGSADEVAGVVSRVIEEKDLEGELDDCRLTRGNLKTLAEVFTNIIEGAYHKRVDDFPESGGAGAV